MIAVVLIASCATAALCNKMVVVFGASGNIGSMVAASLRQGGCVVHGYDPFGPIGNATVMPKSSWSISSNEIKSADVIVFLGGCTGRRACEALSYNDALRENVDSTLNLVGKMHSKQLLLVASTSAVTEGSGASAVPESNPGVSSDVYTQTMLERETALHTYVTRSVSAPKVMLLRFGTVIGVSPAQRTDLLVPSLFKAAYTIGRLPVFGSITAMRHFLTMSDLTNAILQCVNLAATRVPERFSVWHLGSFAARILKVATTVASLTGAEVDAHDEGTLRGFSLNTNKFQTRFAPFTFKGSLRNALIDMDNAVPDSITAKGIHEIKQSRVRCPVCGAFHSQDVLDLGKQPFANDYRKSIEEAQHLPRFSLRLVRCKVCNHMHLSEVADRKELFDNYLYQSGTSTTLTGYFKWLAIKITNETTRTPKQSNVLEIACNDGTQLSQFQALGWKTYGVDPAANLVPIAIAKGHDVTVAYWGVGESEVQYPPLQAIVAQNVFAHVPNPVDFLVRCKQVMGFDTKLYIQTSQCNMHQLGQFDTAYHEHISFFTAHSFQMAAKLAGLEIANFETTPVHGTSCLVTLTLPRRKHSATLQARLQKERLDGITSDFFYTKFAARSKTMATWMFNAIQRAGNAGYTVGAYGAAAKGIVLLHYINYVAASTSNIEFILDDAPLKTGTFAPGTNIPVYSTKVLERQLNVQKVAFVILAWNFWDEIKAKLVHRLRGVVDSFLAILPFPSPREIMVSVTFDSTAVVNNLLYAPTLIPNPLQTQNRHHVLMVSHFNNEELLLPYFIIQHAHMFDKVVLIDYESTDASRAVLNDYAPDNWTVIKSATGAVFGAVECDRQIEAVEHTYPNHWAIALTITEFLMHRNLRMELLSRQNGNCPQIVMRTQAVIIAGNNSIPLVPWKSLVTQRKLWVKNKYDEHMYRRFMHLGTSNAKSHYSTGRHGYSNRASCTQKVDWLSAFVFKFQWAPWPEIASRKVNVGKHIPANDVSRGYGRQHFQIKTIDDLNAFKQKELANAVFVDACNIPRVWKGKEMAVHQIAAESKHCPNK